MLAMLILLGIIAAVFAILAIRYAEQAGALRRAMAAASNSARQDKAVAAAVGESNAVLVQIARNGELAVLGGAASISPVTTLRTENGTLRPEIIAAIAHARAQREARVVIVTQGGQRFRVLLTPTKTGDTEDDVIARIEPELQRDAESERTTRLAARNDAILRSSMDGFFVVGEDYRFLEVNQAFGNMVGYSPAELLQMTILDLEADEPQRTLHGAQYVRTGLHQFPAAHKHKNGSLVFLEISVNVVRDDGRKLIVGFARDITDRRRAEEAVQRLTRQLRLILNSAAEGIIGVDAAGLVIFANPAAGRLLARHPGEMVGRSLHAAACEKQTTATGCKLCERLAELRGVGALDGAFERADGTRFPIELSRNPMFEDGVPVGAVLMFSDISERQQAEAERRRLEGQVHQAQKLESLGLLAGGIAHDFNNILVGILGNACLAAQELPAGSPVKGRLDRIVNAGQRASRVIKQILSYAGQNTPELTAVDLNHAISETAQFQRVNIPEQIDVELCQSADVPRIAADLGQLEQILTNLLMNAVEAIGPNSGSVSLTTRLVTLSRSQAESDFGGQNVSPGDHVLLEVADTGCGMSAQTLSRIFDPFFSGKRKGRGLGLAAIRGIVRAHRGGIAVRSSEGKGTVFQVLFPVAGDELRIEQQAVSPTPRLVPAHTVLVVDDEAEICEVVQSLLESRGMRVLTASGGQAGVAVFRAHENEIDLVLLDMHMPDMDGLQTLRAIREIGPQARVIMSSGHAEDGSDFAAEQEGAAGFIRKPYTLDGLVARITEAIHSDVAAPTSLARAAPPMTVPAPR